MAETYFNDDEIGAAWPPIRVLMPDDPVMGGLDGCDNAAPRALARRTNQLRCDVASAARSIEALQQRLDGLSSADGPALEEALRALFDERYPYRFYETFAPGWTLIDTANRAPVEVVTLTTPVAGDDSLDVSDTACLQTGCCYVLFDGTARQEIEITEILSPRRIRIAPALAIALSDKARLGRTDWRVAPRAAGATMGSSYFTRTLDLGPSSGQRAILVRGSPGAAPVSCQWRIPGGVWAECMWSWQRHGVNHTGQAWREIEYLLPAHGPTQLRVTVDGEAVIQRIVILEAASGLGGIGNGPTQPMALAPKPGEAGIGANASLALSPYASPTGAEQAGLEIELRRDRLTVLSTGLIKGASGSHALPNGLLLPDSRYSWRGRYTDVRGIPSPWSDWAGFSTLATFVALRPPTPLAPADGASGVARTPTLTAAPMAVTGGSDSHIASQWQIATDGDFAAPAHDSGETADLVSHAPVTPLNDQTSYFWRVRHKAARLGWTDWSVARRFSTRMVLVSACSTRLVGPASGSGHQASEWEIRSDERDGSLIWSSGVTSTALTEVTPPGCPAPLTAYRARVRYRLGTEWSGWSDDAVFTSGSEPIGEVRFIGAGGDWVVPDGVTSISGVAIGTGGAGWGSFEAKGGGGGLAWFNNRSVIAGAPIPVVIGRVPDVGHTTADTSVGRLVTACAGRSTPGPAHIGAVAGGDIYGADGGGRGGDSYMALATGSEPARMAPGDTGGWLNDGRHGDIVACTSTGRGLTGLRKWVDGWGVERNEERDKGTYGRGGVGGSGGLDYLGVGAVRLIWGLYLDGQPRSYPYHAEPLY